MKSQTKVRSAFVVRAAVRGKQSDTTAIISFHVFYAHPTTKKVGESGDGIFFAGETSPG